MAYFAPWNFVDDHGQQWAVGMNAAGQITFTSVSVNNAVSKVPLLDLTTKTTVNLVVLFTSHPTLTPIAGSGPTITPNYIPVTRPGVGTYRLQVSSGNLVANPVGDGPGLADPITGELYNYDLANPPKNPPNLANAGLSSGLAGGWLPPYTQPGGIGTQSQPQQASGSGSQITGIPYEQGMGLNVSPCGHWFNNWDIAFSTVGGQQAAVVRCPLCGYVYQLITPASLLYTENYEHISS